MKNIIIRYSLLCVILFLSVNVFAQKDVRKNVRSGNKAYSQQKFSEAYSFFEEALNENASSPVANYNIANTLYRQKNWEEAINHYNNFLSVEGDDAEKASLAWHNIGNAMLEQKNLQESMEAYKMALRFNSEDDEARYNLAVVQKMIQDQEEDEQPEQQEQQQNENQQEQQDNPNQPKKTEQSPEPEQMSRDNARQLLQAIEQDEKETLEKVNKMKAEDRKQKSDENKKRNKDW